MSYFLHQYLKFLLEGVEYYVHGDLKPFSMHEVGIYEDALFYLPKNPIFSLPKRREDKEKKEKNENIKR